MNITIPYNFEPRVYQLPVLKAMDGKIKRGVAVWHRRAGKDKSSLNFMIKKMFERVGVYYYFLPTYQQGKKIIWDGIDGNGFKFTHHFPKNIIKKKNEAEMKIELVNGSIFQVIGTDNIDSIVGTNPVGCIFSEYALQNPLAWDFIRPILRENKGWALFVYTPRGENHGYDLYEMAKKNPDWFCEKLTIEDTGSVTKEDIDKDRREGMSEDLIQQEYYCSFKGAIHGSYYSTQIKKADADGRITKVPYQELIPVDTYWDLGTSKKKTDATSIIFVQDAGLEVHIIDYYGNSGEGLAHYVQMLQSRGYTYGNHYAPHDIEVRELGTGKTRLEMAAMLNLHFIVLPRIKFSDGIEAARMVFSKCWFDEEKAEHLVKALKHYRKEYDEKLMKFKDRPLGDWSADPADAFRMMALGHHDHMRLGHYDAEEEELRLIKERERGYPDPLRPFQM